MKRPLLVLCATLCLFLSTTVHAKDTWTSVRSQNFHLVGNASEKDVRQVAIRLEQFRLVFSRLFKRARLNDSVPTTVVVFKDQSSYRPYNPRAAAGYFQSGEDINYITLTAEVRSANDNPFSVIFHEYVHLLVKNNVSANTPAWINEGLAEYFSTLEVSKDATAADIGKAIPDHVFYLREQKLLPLRTLFAVDHSSAHYNEQNKRGVFYAQAWALVHYLMLGKDKQRQPQLNKYLDLVAQGVSQQKSFETAFGADIDAIEKELKEYIRKDRYPYLNVPFDEKLEVSTVIESLPLTEAQAFAYLGDLALHSPYLREVAEKNLEKAVQMDPNNPMAQASLGMLRMRQRRFAEAKDHLRRAVASDARNHLAHFYYAYVLSREGMSEMGLISDYPDAIAEEMRATLYKAIQLKPDYPESYYLFAFVNSVTGEYLDESIELLKRALILSPGEERFHMSLAQLYMNKQDFDAARKVIEPLAENSPDPKVKSNAQTLLKSIINVQDQITRYRSQRDESENTSQPRSGSPPRLLRRTPPAEKNETETSAAEPTVEPRTRSVRSDDDSRTLGMSVEEAMMAAMREALRKPQTGETRVRGVLTRIECNSKGAVFHIRVGDQVLKLKAGDMRGVHFMAFTQKENGEISCGVRNPESQVVVTYRARDKGGDLVAVEFVPASFALDN